jgi:regulation of enolase protein 1 (concanavalin A-like superfamily)
MDKDRMTYDPGRYVFEIGASSADIRGRVTATLSGTLDRKLKTVWASADATVLRIGDVTRSSFSACMNDDSFENGLKAIWTSNNPSVARVEADGTVTALRMGVATITCTVTAGGVTLSDSFAVKVMPNLGIASLKVDGKPVKLGDADQYSFLRKAGKAPKVEAVAADPAIKVSVKQAEAIPGTAVVTLFDRETGDSRKLTVNFGTKGVSDNFNKNVPGSQWSWVREDPNGRGMKDGELIILSEEEDIAQRSNSAGNILLQNANSDWTIETKVRCLNAPLQHPTRNAGLVAYECDDNFVKLVRTATFNFRRQQDAGPTAGQLQLLVEENGQQKSVENLSMEGIAGWEDDLWLRLVKQGDNYTAWYSVDGKKFVKMGTAKAVLEDIRVGVIACGGVMPAMRRNITPETGPGLPAPDPFVAAFDDFKIVSSGLK